MQFWSVNKFAKRFRKTKTIRHKSTLTTSPTNMLDVTRLPICFLFVPTLRLAVVREMISVNPLDTIVSSTIKTESAT